MSQYQGNIIIKNPATPTGPAENGSAPGIWTLNEALRFTRQGIWPTQGVQGRDAYFNYVSMLLSTTSLGNANNNLFVDSSGAFNLVSRNGNTTQGSVTPYSPNWSNYFDGSSTLTFSSISLAGDFTIEAWVYYTSTSGNPTFVGANPPNNQALRRLSGKHYFYFQGPSITGTIDIPANQWVHLAVTRSSNTVRIFTNGVLDGSASMSGTFSVFCVGGVDTGTDRLTGYGSNVRIVNGTAVYTSTFTPPTSPLTAISGTVLLTCQSNRFRDASSSPYTITVNGNTSVQDFNPFSPGSAIAYNQSDITNWSGYFQNTVSGNHLRWPFPGSPVQNAVAGTNYTIEFWVYRLPKTNTYQCMFSTENDRNNIVLDASGNVVITSNGQTLMFSGFSADTYIPTYQWTHVALVCSGTTWTLYFNGTSYGTYSGASKTSYATGVAQLGARNDMDGCGYMSNFRVSTVARYSGNFTPSTTPFTNDANTAMLTLQSAAFADNSSNAQALEIRSSGGFTPTVTGNSPFGPTGYWSLSGTSTQGATIPQTTATDLGSGSFTLECWVNISDYSTGGVVTKRRTDTALTGSWGIFVNTSGFIIFTGVGWASTYTATTGAIPLGRWTHLAVSRSGTNLSVFVNGVRVINVTDSYNYTCSTYTIIKLAGNAGGNYPSGGALNSGFTGSISNLRIVQGTAVYDPASTTVTVPTSPLTAISGTSLLTLQDGRMKDNSTNNNTNILLYSGATIQSFDPFYTSTTASNGGSMYFDGTGDYLSVGSNAALPAGNALYTIEAWIYPTALNANNGVVGWGSWGTNNAVNAVKITSTTLNNYWWNNDLNASFAFKTGSWYHIVCQFDGTTRSAYVNGTRIATDTPTGHNVPFPVTNCTVGTTNNASENFTGYISGLKVTSGAALYSGASYTVPTTPATPAASTSLLVNGMNAGIYDATAINDMETVGNAQVTTAVSKFGGSSVYFDGTGDYLTSNAASDLYTFGTGDFTIEMWFNLSSFSSLQILYDSRPTSTDGLYPLIYVASGGGSVIWQISATARITGTATLSTGVWYHLAVSRSSGSTKMFLNGTQVGSTYADTNAYLNSGTTRPFIGGSSYSAGTLTVNGYIDDLRVTKGIARYTANFTPPTQAFPTY